MSAGAWVALITTGLFCTLSSYSAGAYWPMAKRNAPTKPVVLWKKMQERCDQTDWLCLVAWAEEIKKGN